MKRATAGCLIYFYLLASQVVRGQQTPPKPSGFSERERDFCDALARAVAGAEIEVQVSGVIKLGEESRLFYDPDEPECRFDLQPVAAVDFLQGEDFSKLRGLLKKYGKAKVDVEGTLYGPLSLKPDEAELPLIAAFINRIKGRRYGHMDIFRTKLLVRHVGRAERLKTDIPPPVISRRETPALNPLEFMIPVYPEAARHAGIEGDVVMRLTVTGGRAASIHLLAGDRIFEHPITEAIEHWRFDAQAKGTLDSIFSFRLEQRLSGSNRDPRIEATPPHFMRITAPGDYW